MHQVAIQWNDTDSAIGQFCDFFRSDRPGRDAFRELALATGNVQMAAIAAAGERRLQPGPVADGLAEAVADAALVRANARSAIADFAGETNCLHAGFVAVKGLASAETRMVNRLEERVAEELERDPIDPAVLRSLASVQGFRRETLLEIFTKADTAGEVDLAASVAQAIVDAGGRQINRTLLSALRARVRDLIASRDGVTALAYFLPLYYMARDVPSVQILLPRVTRLAADVLTAALNAPASGDQVERLRAGLAELEPDNQALLLARALYVAGSEAVEDLDQILNRLNERYPEGWRQILAHARRFIKAGEDRRGLALYDWLGRHAFVPVEAEKAKRYALRERVSALRLCASDDNAAVQEAAAAVREIDPDNERALWLEARALMRMRKTQPSLELFRQLNRIAPAHPHAASFIQRLEQKTPQAKSTQSAVG